MIFIDLNVTAFPFLINNKSISGLRYLTLSPRHEPRKENTTLMERSQLKYVFLKSITNHHLNVDAAVQLSDQMKNSQALQLISAATAD